MKRFVSLLVALMVILCSAFATNTFVVYAKEPYKFTVVNKVERYRTKNNKKVHARGKYDSKKKLYQNRRMG